MCGIAGYCLNPEDHFINARRLAQALLLGIEERGKDATGAAWRNRNGHIVTQKRDVTARSFVGDLSLDKRANLAILHTRAWTQGKPENPLNNHPITAGDIVGVHNGFVSNDTTLLREAEKLNNYEQQGEVDSEAIFATIDRVNVGEKKFTLVDALEAIDAKMAIAWIDLSDGHDNTLHLARGDGSPLVIGQTVNGSLIFASTESAVTEAAKACGIELPYIKHVKEGLYLKARDGIIVEQQHFFPSPAWYYSGRTSYASSAYSTTTTTKVQPQVVKEHQSTYLDLRYLDPDTEIPEQGTAAFTAANPDRNKAVNKWIEDHAYIDGDDDWDEGHAVFAKAAEYGAFLRMGTWVQTPFKGEWCDAQVYKVPKTFPAGDYILRVLVPYEDGQNKTWFEPVLLARSIMDLEGPALHFGDLTKDKDKTEPIAELTAGDAA